jgi:hypothetical protein
MYRLMPVDAWIDWVNAFRANGHQRSRQAAWGAPRDWRPAVGGKLAGGTVRKKAVFGPQSADNFSELSLMEKTLSLPFQAEYEGSIPSTRSNDFKNLARG